MGNAFQNPKKKVTFIGGPADGDTIRLDDETKALEVLDSNDENVRHFYLRASETELVFTNSNTRKTAETND